MSFGHGKNTKVYVDQYDLTAYFNAASTQSTVSVAETTTFGKNSKTYIVGISDGKASLQGYYDKGPTGVEGVAPVMRAAFGGSAGQVLTVGREGDAIGKVADILLAKQTQYEIAATLSDAVKVNCDLQADGGIDSGVFLHPLSAETAGGNSTSVDGGTQQAAVNVTAVSVANPTHLTATAHGFANGDVVELAGFSTTPTINGPQVVTVLDADHFTVPVNVTVVTTGTGTATRTNTRSGLAAHLHVSAFTGTTLTVKVQHSVDNTVWVDLVTFVAKVAVGSERQVVSGNVNRYLRELRTATITAVTFAVAAARQVS
jgi:hypothetical protein